jgi:subtilisin family serine protease
VGVVGGAPHSTIVPVRVLDCSGSGTTSTVASGIEWASDPAGGAAKVISLSLSGPGPSSVEAQAIRDALARNVVVVVAAGNCGDASCPDGPPNTAEYPGAFADQAGFQGEGLLAVGALNGANPANPIRRASFSNSNPYVTVAAPGVNIDSTVPSSGAQITDSTGYRTLSGTSMATPHVSAVAALILQRCPSDTPAQVETRILNGTRALPVPSDFASGAVGLLRADAVLSGGSCP